MLGLRMSQSAPGKSFVLGPDQLGPLCQYVGLEVGYLNPLLGPGRRTKPGLEVRWKRPTEAQKLALTCWQAPCLVCPRVTAMDAFVNWLQWWQEPSTAAGWRRRRRRRRLRRVRSDGRVEQKSKPRRPRCVDRSAWHFPVREISVRVAHALVCSALPWPLPICAYSLAL
jgi:hypothetical protein